MLCVYATSLLVENWQDDSTVAARLHGRFNMIHRIHWLAALTVVSACTVTTTPAPSRPYEPPPREVREHRPPPPPPPNEPPPPPRSEQPPPYQPPPGPPPRNAPEWDSTGWMLLGEHKVDRGIDSDQFDFSQKRGKISKVMVVVLDSDLELLDFKIVYVNGEVYNPPTRHTFREGSRTRPIELPKSEILRAVQLKYRNLPGGGPARVQVWAR
jgi:hypothetical protein